MRVLAALGQLFASGSVASASSTANEDMSVLAFGSTGLLGLELTYQALKRNVKVAAFLRDPAKLKAPQGSGGDEAGQPLASDDLTVVQGSVTSADDVDKAFNEASGGVKAVIVALGGRTGAVGKTMLTDGTSNIIRAMTAHNVKRVVVVTTIGCGDSYYQAPFIFRVLMNTVMRAMISDKNNQEALFLSEGAIGKDLDYVIVRPGGLTTDKPAGVVNVLKEGAGRIARADVASFMLDAALEPAFPFLKKTPAISSVGGVAWSKNDAKKGEL